MFPIATTVKVIAGAAAIAFVLYLLHLYGDAKYEAGQAAQKAEDAAQMLTAYQKQQSTLDDILAASSLGASNAQAATTAVVRGIASVRAEFKGKTLTVMRQGECQPSGDLINQWNAISTINRKK